MARSISHTRIYKAIAYLLGTSPMERAKLIERCVDHIGLSAEEKEDNSLGSTKNLVRSRAGAVINEMHVRSLIGLDEFGRYYLISERPVIIRIEKCEKEILSALTEGPISKSDLRQRLKTVFGTDKTVTTRDDDTLSTYMGQIMKRLVAEKAVRLNNGIYTLSPKISARADNINALLTLKSEFLQRLHAKGGEFFENYFMALLSSYSKKHGKRVLESYVTGGTSDGGIDGVMKTEDSLGFRELTMVQTKNRVEISSETDVRGFYGAVCAKRGTRGIFATTSDFHSSARDFMNSLDDLVGINGERVFSMAIECSYGIKKHADGTLEIDTKLL